MQLSKMKNIIVLKGMASNVVDEAIVVLKPNIQIKQSEYYNGKNKKVDNNKKLILMKEAENTIDMYVQKLEKNTKNLKDRKFKIKYRFLQISNCILIMIILISSLLLF